ncbi:hypothetical protein ACA910_002946 [Epithemia clementina (nom. ined.)]
MRSHALFRSPFGQQLNGTGSLSSALVVGATSLVAASPLIYYFYQQRKQHRQQLQRSNHSSSAAASSSLCIYLDYNGTTPVYPFVVQTMMPYLTEHYGNPSSSHAYGTAPRQAMHQARRQILKLLLGTNAGESSNVNDNDDDNQQLLSSIWFTSCGTEADNLAIHLALYATRHLFSANNNNNNGDGTQKTKLPHIVTSNIEHPAVEACLKMLQEQEGKCHVTYVPVQPDGRVLAQDVIDAIRPGETILVTLMLANNETGALQPIRPVAEYCREHGILFHTDAAQAAGKVSLVDAQSADMVTLVGHKMGAPKGIACLYVRPGCLASLSERGQSSSGSSHLLVDAMSKQYGGILLQGGGQEFGRRGGTENVPYMVGFGAAAERAALELPAHARHMEHLRQRLLNNLQQGLAETEASSTQQYPLLRVHGPTAPDQRLPNTLSIGIRGIHSGTLLQALSQKVAASAGATCHSNNQVSSVLRAMQVPLEYARGTLRLSVGPYTTEAHVDRASHILVQEIQNMLQQQQQQQEEEAQ